MNYIYSSKDDLSVCSLLVLKGVAKLHAAEVIYLKLWVLTPGKEMCGWEVSPNQHLWLKLFVLFIYFRIWVVKTFHLAVHK